MDPPESENRTTSFLDLYCPEVGIEKEQELKDWSNILVRKKVMMTRARAPIWWVRVHGVTVLLANGLVLLLCMLPIVVATEQSSEVSVDARKKMGMETVHEQY